MSCVLITGGTGMTGTALTSALVSRGHDVIVMTRDPDKQAPPGKQVSYAAWDPDAGTLDRQAVERADFVVHLAGAGVADKRWTTRRKKEIVSSRVVGAKAIVNALSTIPNKVQAVLAASAIGWYGPDHLREKSKPAFTETDPPDPGFLGETCRQWEESVMAASSAGKRVVIFRTGIILSPRGGALEEFRKPLRFGVAAIMGNGQQVMSWIHIDDLVGMYLAAMEKVSMTGIYNAVAPAPVSNKALTLALARTGRKRFVPVRIPSFLLKAVLGEMSIEVLKSATVSAGRIAASGFTFRYPEVEKALDHIMNKS